jgi:hypothetical protein
VGFFLPRWRVLEAVGNMKEKVKKPKKLQSRNILRTLWTCTMRGGRRPQRDNNGTTFTWFVFCASFLSQCIYWHKNKKRHQPPPDPHNYHKMFRENFYEFDKKLCLPRQEGSFRLACNITSPATETTQPMSKRRCA